MSETAPNGAKCLSVSQLAYDRLKRDIVRCELAPGVEVTEVQLAERYGLSRAAVRSALARLAQARLVQAMPRQGYQIAPITLKHVHDLFGARLLLEPAVTRLAAGRLTAEQLRRLEALNEARYRPGDRESREAFLRANTEFHSIIARASGNDRLASMVGGVLDDMERLLNLSHMQYDRNEETPREHAQIIEVLRAGDGRRAEQAALEHIHPMRTLVIELLMSNPSLQRVNLAAV